MNILEKLLGNNYPKLGSAVCADGNRTVDGKFNSIDDLRHLAFIARGISEIAEDRLSEPNAIKAIRLDCKQFICTDDEPEEAQADA